MHLSYHYCLNYLIQQQRSVYQIVECLIQNHLHHLLVDLGIQPRVTLALILVISISLNALGVWIIYAISPVASLVAYGLLLVGFGYAMLNPSIERKIALKLRLID